jgi:lipopolysaccharide assembly outer membrane protein LptD (OstA)
LDQQTNKVTALADRDSLGQVITKAHFEQADNNFETDSMSFNLKSQKGLTYNTITQQQEMFVHGEKIKKVNATTFFVSRGQFTTCNLDEPHFAFRTNKLISLLFPDQRILNLKECLCLFICLLVFSL